MYIHKTYTQIEQMAHEVSSVCKQHGITPSLTSDLSKMIKICENASSIAKGNDDQLILDLCQAQRVVSAIIACKDELMLSEPLRRIASSVLEPASKEHSLGKDALFELEFLQYLKVKGYDVRLGEPDIIMNTPWGEWFIACKTVNSFNNFEKQLSSGCQQVVSQGHGCVAINYEPQSEFQEKLLLEGPEDARHLIDEHLFIQTRPLKRHVNKRIRDGRLDGVIFSTSCYVKFESNNSDLDVYTAVMYSSDTDNQAIGAVERFNYVSHKFDNIVNRGF
ncbi:hypothetical protein ACN09D_25490 (plasmid) [Serratia fonticola]|uniref:hypothetical protein n=1 Tax=Serratia fonticola TaxID=47917 RepID=UPI003AF3AA90